METGSFKAWLAALVTVGFLGYIFVLFFAAPIPTATKDVLLVLLGALVGIVKDVFGFYFGSSEGSFRKTEMMANLPSTASIPPDQAGFISQRLCLAIAALFLTGVMLYAGGCATTQPPTQPSNPITPYAQAATNLRLARTGIISAARVADSLCTKGVMKQAACDQAKDIYLKSEQACDVVKSGIIIWLDTGNPEQYNKSAADLAQLASHLADITKTPPGGAK